MTKKKRQIGPVRKVQILFKSSTAKKSREKLEHAVLTFYLTNLQEIFFSEEKDIIMVYRNLDFKIRINPLKSKDDYFTSLYNYYSLLSQNTN